MVKQVQAVIDKWIVPHAKKAKCFDTAMQTLQLLSKSLTGNPTQKMPASLPPDLDVFITKVQSKDEEEPDEELWNYDSLAFLYLNMFH